MSLEVYTIGGVKTTDLTGKTIKSANFDTNAPGIGAVAPLKMLGAAYQVPAGKKFVLCYGIVTATYSSPYGPGAIGYSDSPTSGPVTVFAVTPKLINTNPPQPFTLLGVIPAGKYLVLQNLSGDENLYQAITVTGYECDA